MVGGLLPSLVPSLLVGVAVGYLLRACSMRARVLSRHTSSHTRTTEPCASPRSTPSAPAASAPLSREVPLVLARTALLVIDMQNYCCHPDGGNWRDGSRQPSAHYMHYLPRVLRNIQALLAAARAQRVECIFTTIESLTRDGRDRSLDYKISGFNVPRGSWDGRVVEPLAPRDDEIVIPKCSSSAFCSTNLAYKLRNLGCNQLVIVGGLTDQCIDSAVRDACDLGFLVTLPTDACITHSAERHTSALANNKGYCRQLSTCELLSEIGPPTLLPPSWGCEDLMAAWARVSPSRGDLGARPSTQREQPALPSSREGQANAVGPRKYIRFELIDMNGRALSKVVPARHQGEGVEMYRGAICAGANSEVLLIPPEVAAAGCPNAALLPDWSTCVLLPWAGQGPSFAQGRGPSCGVVVHRVYCEQEGVAALPRTVCKRMLRRLQASHGLHIFCAAELEFCLAQADDWAAPAFSGPQIFVTLQQTKVGGFCSSIEEAMQAVGIDVRTINAEYGSGQLEITIAPKLGLEAADAACTFRTAVKELAQQQGLLATFQSKPFALDGPGNGGHLNFSLWQDEWQGDRLLSADNSCESRHVEDGMRSAHHHPLSEDDDQLTPVARCFLAGVLAHARALEAFCSPTPPCYERHGRWAPTTANYGPDDRTCAVRVKRGSHFELRMPSASACSYLVIAALVAAGLDGIERELSLPPSRQTEAQGSAKLPTSLKEALEALEMDACIRAALGEELISWFLLVKRGELEAVEHRIAQNTSRIGASDAQLEAWRHFFMEFL
ncbi:MAG: hypothetical protein SGPRY_005075 [Prymnesium sp.]